MLRLFGFVKFKNGLIKTAHNGHKQSQLNEVQHHPTDIPTTSQLAKPAFPEEQIKTDWGWSWSTALLEGSKGVIFPLWSNVEAFCSSMFIRPTSWHQITKISKIHSTLYVILNHDPNHKNGLLETFWLRLNALYIYISLAQSLFCWSATQQIIRRSTLVVFACNSNVIPYEDSL